MNIRQRATVTDAAIVMVSCAILLTAALGVTQRRGVTAQQRSSPVHILVDPGHGGDDGGAVAADGTPEKDINLSVSLSLSDLLRVMGFSVSMTRETDAMIHTTGTTLRERKVSDMKNRLAMSEAADMTVSIHQNKFSQAKYYGTQVFYSGNHQSSRVLAQAVRESVVSLLQPENTRELKKGDSSVYLLSHATKPMILVECGFLSNPTELEKLKDSTYQGQLAFAVMGGVLKGRT